MQKEGIVKFYNTKKGFGFIIQTHDRHDIFVHASGLIDDIRENDRVLYYIESGKKGLAAVDVELIEN